MKALITFLIISSLLFAACSDSPNTPQQQQGPPQIPERVAVQLALPANAPQAVKTYLNSTFILYNTLFNLFDVVRNNPAQGTHSNWSWQADFDPWQLIVQAMTLSEQKSEWKVILNGSGLENWLSSTGIIQAGGATGEWTFYLFDSETIDATSSWSRDAQGALVVTTLLHERPQTERAAVLIDITGRADNSGELLVRDENGNTILTANWDASGAGTWASYSAARGQQTGSGTWRS